jgi:hypothetical protein
LSLEFERKETFVVLYLVFFAYGRKRPWVESMARLEGRRLIRSWNGETASWVKNCNLRLRLRFVRQFHILERTFLSQMVARKFGYQLHSRQRWCKKIYGYGRNVNLHERKAVCFDAWVKSCGIWRHWPVPCAPSVGLQIRQN